MAYHDSITDLPNGYLLNKYLNTTIPRAKHEGLTESGMTNEAWHEKAQRGFTKQLARVTGASSNIIWKL